MKIPDRPDFLNPKTQKLLSGEALQALGLENRQGLFEQIIIDVERARDKGRIRTFADSIRFVLHRYAISAEDLRCQGIESSTSKEAFYNFYHKEISKGLVQNRGQALGILQRFSASMSDKREEQENIDLSAGNRDSEFSISDDLSGQMLEQTVNKVVQTFSDDFQVLCDVAVRFVGSQASLGSLRARMISRETAGAIIQKEMAKYYSSVKFSIQDKDKQKKLAGFFLAEKFTIFILPQNLGIVSDDEIKALLFHEIIHAIQHTMYPLYRTDGLDRCLLRRAQNSAGNHSVDLDYDLSQSIKARTHWLECHANYFESIYADDLLWEDDSRTIEETRWVLGLETLFRNGNVKSSLSPGHVAYLVHRLFSEPWLADVIFRDDGVVCAEVPLPNRQKFEKEVKSFMTEFTPRNSLRFVYI